VNWALSFTDFTQLTIFYLHFTFHVIQKFLNIVGLDHADGFAKFGDHDHIISRLDADEGPYVLGDDDLSLGTYGHIPVDLHFKCSTSGHVPSNK
jgi:hypothetical protein